MVNTERAVSLAVNTLLENPDFDFVYGDFIYTDEKGNPQFLMKGDKNYRNKINYTMPSIFHPTVFIKRTVYNSCGPFDTSYKIAMDYEFYLRITHLEKKGIYIEKPFSLMAFGGISYSKFYKSYEEVCRASIKYGYNPIKVYFKLYLKGMRGLVRVRLEAARLNSVVRLLRKIC